MNRRGDAPKDGKYSELPDRPLTDREVAIVNAARSLLRDGGAAAFTTDAVAARADVSKSTIYKRWRSKNELMVSVIDSLVRPIWVPDMGSVEAELRSFLGQRLKQYQRDAVERVFASILGACAEDEALAHYFRSWVRGQMDANREILRRGLERGEISDAWALEDLATLVAAPLVYRLIWQGQAPDEKLLNTIVGSFLAAVGVSSNVS